MIYTDNCLCIDTDLIIGAAKTDYTIMLILDCDQSLEVKYDNVAGCAKAFGIIVAEIKKQHSNSEPAF